MNRLCKNIILLDVFRCVQCRNGLDRCSSPGVRLEDVSSRLSAICSVTYQPSPLTSFLKTTKKPQSRYSVHEQSCAVFVTTSWMISDMNLSACSINIFKNIGSACACTCGCVCGGLSLPVYMFHEHFKKHPVCVCVCVWIFINSFTLLCLLNLTGYSEFLYKRCGCM